MLNPNQTDVKSSAREAIEQLPEDATWDDVMYRISVADTRRADSCRCRV